MKIVPYIKILRPMLYPTAVADAFLGAGCAALAVGSIQEPVQIMNAALVSVLLYAGGMVSNDIVDAKIDKEEGKSRPIPDGEISKFSAYVLFLSLCAACGVVLSFMSTGAIVVAVACMASILLYNVTHKKWKILSPFLIGLCRALSVLIGGMAVCKDFGSIVENPIIFSIIAAYSLYIVAITFISLLEEPPFDRAYIFSAVLAITIAIMAIFPLISVPELKHWFFLYVVVVVFFMLTLISVLASVKRRKNLGKYIPIWISPLTLLGGLGLLFFTIGDPTFRFSAPAIALAALFPLMAGVFYYGASKGD